MTGDISMARVRRAEGECKHCGRAARIYARRLCCRCYHNIDIRRMHPLPAFDYARRGEGVDGEARKPPMQATASMPGTPSKVEVLLARMENKEDLWHSQDATGVEEDE